MYHICTVRVWPCIGHYIHNTLREYAFQDMVHIFIFSFLHLPLMSQERTRHKSPVIGLRVAPYLLSPLHSHPQAPLNEKVTPQRPPHVLGKAVLPRKWPPTLWEMLVVLTSKVGAEMSSEIGLGKLVLFLFFGIPKLSEQFYLMCSVSMYVIL